MSSEYDPSPSLTTNANARPTAPLNPPHQHTVASYGVSPYPHLRRMGYSTAMTTARAKRHSRYTSKP